MKIERLLLAFAVTASLFTFTGCSKDEDDDPDPSNPPGGGGDGKVKITGLSHEYIFWGKELTITGTGFSSVKEENVVSFVNSYPRTPELNLTSNGGDIEILSASPTNITIRIPYHQEPNQRSIIYSGEDYAQIEVAVQNEKDTSEQVKFIGLPRVGFFEYHYGWFDLGGVARSGDSVVLSGGFYGSFLGAGERHPKEAGVYDKLQLAVNGIFVPIKYRRISQSHQGYGMYLPSKDFSEIICEDGENGWNDRAMDFTFSVAGTDIENTRKLFVTYLPESSLHEASGPGVVSKSQDLNPYWEVTGDDMYYTHAVFFSQCEAPDAEMEIANTGVIKNSYQIGIPLSLMEEFCTYNISLKTPCGTYKAIGSVSIMP